MSPWIRIPCIIIGLVPIFAASMALAVMFYGTERQDLSLLAAIGDMILISSGDDFLTGLEGADVMIGKDGNDKFEVDDAGDTVADTNGQGTDTVSASVDFRLTNAQFVEKVRLTGSDDINATGKLAPTALKDLGAPGDCADADDRILHDSGSGVLKYDVNGSDAGGRTVFARLSTKAEIDAGDVLVIA